MGLHPMDVLEIKTYLINELILIKTHIFENKSTFNARNSQALNNMIRYDIL